MITNSSSPKRGDIWLTNFDRTVGAEIKKVRPAIIVSSDGVGKLPSDKEEYSIVNFNIVFSINNSLQISIY